MTLSAIFSPHYVRRLLVAMLSLGLSACAQWSVSRDNEDYAAKIKAQSSSRILESERINADFQALDKVRERPAPLLPQAAAPAPERFWLPDEAAEVLPNKPISLSLKDATLRQAIWVIGKEWGINLTLDDSALTLKQKANFNLVEVEARHALSNLLKTFDAAARLGRGGALIISAEVNESFYIDPNLNRSTMSSVVGGDLLGAGKDAPLRHNKQVSDGFGPKGDGDAFESLTKLIESMLSEDPDAQKSEGRPKAVLGVDRAKGVIFVRAKPSRLQTISSLMDRVVELSSRQMDIDAQIIDVELNDSYRFGIDWNLLSSKVSSAIGSSRVSIPTLNTQPNGSLVPKAVEFTPRTAGDTMNGGFGAMFSNDSIAATVNAIRSFGNVRLVASPTVRLRSGTASNLTVGDVIRYVQSVKTTSTSGGGSSTEVVTESLFSGVSFSVGGRVADNGMIELLVSPSQNTVADGSLALLEVAGAAKLTLPRVKTKSASSWVSIRPGGIVVIGGLIDTIEDGNDTGPPALSEAPGPFGMLFRKEVRLKRTRELLVVLRASIARP